MCVCVCVYDCVRHQVAAAIIDEKLKATDVPSAVTVSSLMHQRYAEFRGCFLMGLLSTLQWCADTAGLCSGKRDGGSGGSSAAAARAKQGTAAASAAKRRSADRLLFNSLSDAVADARTRVVMEAEADDDDFGGMSANKASSAAAAAAAAAGGSGDALSADDIRNAGARCRVLLRLVWEAYRAGIYEDPDAVPVRAGCGEWRGARVLVST